LVDELSACSVQIQDPGGTWVIASQYQLSDRKGKWEERKQQHQSIR
jgi:hypothetical protein